MLSCAKQNGDDVASLLLRLEALRDKLDKAEVRVDRESEKRREIEYRFVDYRSAAEKRISELVHENVKLKLDIESQTEKAQKFHEMSDQLLSDKLSLENVLRRVQKRLNIKQDDYTKLMAEKEMAKAQLTVLKDQIKESAEEAIENGSNGY